MRLFDFILVALITATLAAVLVVFHNDAMPYPVAIQPDPNARAAVHPWTGIWIHSSGTKQGSATSIDKAHAANGGLPFHYVIGNGTETGDGTVEEGFRWKQQIPGLNPDVIEICLVGDLNHDRPTKKQLASLDALLIRLCRERLIPANEIYAESERRPGIACPGKFFNPQATRASIAAALAK